MQRKVVKEEKMKKRHNTYKKKEQNTKDKSNQYATLDVNKINTTVKKNNLAECMKRNVL